MVIQEYCNTHFYYLQEKEYEKNYFEYFFKYKKCNANTKY